MLFTFYFIWECLHNCFTSFDLKRMSLNDINSLIQYFIQKSVQVIVQSRLGTKTNSNESKSNQEIKDLFNLDIKDYKDVAEQTNKCLKQTFSHLQTPGLYFIKKDWKICCEISLKNSDGFSIVLEYWMFYNSLPREKDFEINHNSANKNQNNSNKIAQVMHETFIRMSTMIKSLIVLTRSTPAYKISCKGQNADSYVICYRVYQFDENFVQSHQQQQTLNRGKNHFSSMKTIGSIKCFQNEITISFIYRTDMNIISESEIKNLVKNEEQELSSIYNTNNSNGSLIIKEDHFKKEVNEIDMFDLIKPLNPAFVVSDPKSNYLNFILPNLRLSLFLFVDKYSNKDLSIPFNALLTSNEQKSSIETESSEENHTSSSPINNGTKTNPISIPKSISAQANKSHQIYSTSNESFIFVELNAPFASEDSGLSSFFNGPSPTFAKNSTEIGYDGEIDLGTQLAELESDVPQIDSFVESICISENEDFKYEA